MPGDRYQRARRLEVLARRGYAGSSLTVVEGDRVRAIDGVRRGIEANRTGSR